MHNCKVEPSPPDRTEGPDPLNKPSMEQNIGGIDYRCGESRWYSLDFRLNGKPSTALLVSLHVLLSPEKITPRTGCDVHYPWIIQVSRGLLCTFSVDHTV
jgi:hypothetical protein